MAKKVSHQPVKPFHPGEVLLEEFLLPRERHADRVCGAPRMDARASQRADHGKRGITAEAALDLAEALGTSPRLWMNLQATFDLAAAEKKRAA
jgi:addiction module HigA family antidote